jgi:hypothetical protein
MTAYTGHAKQGTTSSHARTPRRETRPTPTAQPHESPPVAISHQVTVSPVRSHSPEPPLESTTDRLPNGLAITRKGLPEQAYGRGTIPKKSGGDQPPPGDTSESPKISRPLTGSLLCWAAFVVVGFDKLGSQVHFDGTIDAIDIASGAHA